MFLKDLIYLVLPLGWLPVEKERESSLKVLNVLFLSQPISPVEDILSTRLNHSEVRLDEDNLTHVLLIMCLLIPREYFSQKLLHNYHFLQPDSLID